MGRVYVQLVVNDCVALLQLNPVLHLSEQKLIVTQSMGLLAQVPWAHWHKFQGLIGTVCVQLVVNDCVALVKLNPVNDFTGTQLERLLEPLHTRGFFRCVYGGAAVVKVRLSVSP